MNAILQYYKKRKWLKFIKQKVCVKRFVCPHSSFSHQKLHILANAALVTTMYSGNECSLYFAYFPYFFRLLTLQSSMLAQQPKKLLRHIPAAAFVLCFQTLLSINHVLSWIQVILHVWSS